MEELRRDGLGRNMIRYTVGIFNENKKAAVLVRDFLNREINLNDYSEMNFMQF